MGVDCELSTELDVGMRPVSVLSCFIFAVVVDVVTELAREGVLCELLYAGHLVMMSEAMDGLEKKFMK